MRPARVSVSGRARHPTMVLHHFPIIISIATNLTMLSYQLTVLDSRRRVNVWEDGSEMGLRRLFWASKRNLLTFVLLFCSLKMNKGCAKVANADLNGAEGFPNGLINRKIRICTDHHPFVFSWAKRKHVHSWYRCQCRKGGPKGNCWCNYTICLLIEQRPGQQQEQERIESNCIEQNTISLNRIYQSPESRSSCSGFPLPIWGLRINVVYAFGCFRYGEVSWDKSKHSKQTEENKLVISNIESGYLLNGNRF